MKKLISVLLFAFAAIFMSQVSHAQVRAYKQIYIVDANGVKRKGFGHINYYTFINGNSLCYFSDKNGNSRGSGSGTYEYKGTKNGMLVYQGFTTYYGSSRRYYSGSDFMYFSTDYTRMNMRGLFGETLIFEYVANPDEVDAPSQLY